MILIVLLSHCSVSRVYMFIASCSGKEERLLPITERVNYKSKSNQINRGKVYLNVSQLEALFSLYFLYKGCFRHLNGLLTWVGMYGKDR